jgi:hypothetical protein
MERKNVYLLIGLILSAISKWLQFRFNAGIGDILILPAATFFVLAILNYQKPFQILMGQPDKHKEARLFSLYCCLSVLCFQLLTMITFGWGYAIGIAFTLPFLVFLRLAWNRGKQLFGL